MLHTTSRPQAWPSWAQQSGLDAKALKYGQGFEHLYYLLEAAVAGLGVAIAPEPLVAEDLKAGRLVAPWGFSETPAQLALWLPKRAADGRARQLAQWLKNELRQTRLVTALEQQISREQAQRTDSHTGCRPRVFLGVVPRGNPGFTGFDFDLFIRIAEQMARMLQRVLGVAFQAL